MSGALILAVDDHRWIAVCSREKLAEKKIVCATVSGVSLLVLQEGNDIRACERACPHEQADLSHGRLTDGRLHCPRHLAWFDLDSGAISPGWHSRPLRRYPIRVTDGMVWIDRKTLLAGESGP